MATKIKVLLVDDHSLVRRGFRRMLEDEADIVVVGEASNGDEAVQLALALAPQVIVMDCALPRTSGLGATRKILQSGPANGNLDAEHALGRYAGAPGTGRGSSRLHPQKCGRPGTGNRHSQSRGRRNCARRAIG